MSDETIQMPTREKSSSLIFVQSMIQKFTIEKDAGKPNKNEYIQKSGRVKLSRIGCVKQVKHLPQERLPFGK